MDFYPPTTQMLRMPPGTEYTPIQDREEETEEEEEKEDGEEAGEDL